MPGTFRLLPEKPWRIAKLDAVSRFDEEILAAFALNSDSLRAGRLNDHVKVKDALCRTLERGSE